MRAVSAAHGIARGLACTARFATVLAAPQASAKLALTAVPVKEIGARRDKLRGVDVHACSLVLYSDFSRCAVLARCSRTVCNVWRWIIQFP